MGSSSLYNVGEDNALFMSLRIRKYMRQCQESHTNVFNQLILSFIRCKFMAYFREINHDISLINLKISVEKEGKNICFHWSELRMKCQRRKKRRQTYVDVTNEQLFFVLSWWEKQFFFIFKVQQLLKVIEITYNMQTHIFVQLHFFCSLFELQMSNLSVVGIDFFFLFLSVGKIYQFLV